MSEDEEIEQVKEFLEKPHRIQRKRTKGWKMPDNTVYVGRPTKWGNPFTIEGAIEAGHKPEDAQRMTVFAFQECLMGNPYYTNNPELKKKSLLFDEVLDLRGKNLACFCPLDKPCHADILLRLANDPYRQLEKSINDLSRVLKKECASVIDQLKKLSKLDF